MENKPKVKCEICGNEFVGTRSLSRHCNKKHNISNKEYYDMFLKKEGEGICLQCGKETNFNRMGKGYYVFCSPLCAQNNPKTKQKAENTSMKRYGTKSPQQSKIVREKTEKTNNERYGGNSPQSSKEILEKTKRTNMVRYGGISPASDPKIVEKMKKTYKERTGYDNPSYSPETIKKEKKPR